MERLTKRDCNGNPYFISKCFDDGVLDDGIIAEYVAELEDKLESGELLELPCKVGDTVYFVYSGDQRMPFPFIVQKIGLKTIDGELRFFVYDENDFGGRYGDFHRWYIGKDKKAAYARLKELQEQKR